MSEDTGILKAIQDDILTELSGITQVKTVDVWQGEIEDLLKTPQKLPSLNIIYKGAEYESMKREFENIAMSLDYLIILIVKNQKSRKDSLLEAYTIIEAVRDKLKGHKIADYDFLRPRREDLLMAEGGILVYGLVYGMDMVELHTSS